ncbi:dicarboxylate/amino acid:cation symporter [soil metagenome]
MFGLKLHWWILIGIAAGFLAGIALHKIYYEPQMHEARVAVLGENYTPEQAAGKTREIQRKQDELLRGTIAGGAVDGIGRLFLNLLKMVVIPLVFTSLISGVAGLGDPKRLGRLGLRTLAWYVTTSLIAILTGLLLVNLIRPGVGVNLPVPTGVVPIATPDSAWDVVLNMVPSNVIKSMADFDLFPVIFFALMFGVFALLVRPDVSSPVIAVINGVFEIMMRMTMFIIALAPIGIAALIAKLTAVSGPTVFVELIWYVLTVALGLILHFGVTLPLMFWLFTRRNPYRVMRAMSPALLTAFSTASSSGTLPLTLERLEHGVGVRNKISSFVLPLGATINMDGTALYEIVATIFVAQVYAHANPDFTLTFGHQITIVLLSLMVSIGAAGIPSAGLVMMVIIFKAVGLPLELTGLLWAVDRVLDMFRTSVNVWSDVMGAATVAHFENEIDDSVMFRGGERALEKKLVA